MVNRMNSGRLSGSFLSTQFERATNLEIKHFHCHYLYNMLNAFIYSLFDKIIFPSIKVLYIQKWQMLNY